ncbi:MAG: S9 family peptidase, partial [Variibacter sp.]|nr:S9 family peptidase [Variibacter sp.]
MLIQPPDAAPVAEQRAHAQSWHGHTLSDAFAWLKAPNWQEVLRNPAALDPAIRHYLEAENAYAEAALRPLQELEARLHAEMKGRLKQDDWSVPIQDGPFGYFSRYREGGQHRLVCRRAADGSEQVLLDGDRLAEGQAFFQLGAVRHSPDHRLLAWGADTSGAELFVVRVRELASGVDLADQVPEVAGSSVVWMRDGAAFYYSRLDENHRPSRVFRHRLGTPATDDELIFEESDPQYFVAISRMQSGAYAEINVSDHETSQCWLLDLADPAASPRLIAARETGVLYDTEHHPGLHGAPALVIRTNADGCEDFKLVRAPLADPSRAQWKELVPYRPGVFLVAFAVRQDWLIRLEREDGLPRIVARALRSGEEHAITFEEEAYALGMDAGLEFATDTLRFDYSSLATPSEVWDYDLAARTRSLRKRQEVPSGHD